MIGWSLVPPSALEMTTGVTIANRCPDPLRHSPYSCRQHLRHAGQSLQSVIGHVHDLVGEISQAISAAAHDSDFPQPPESLDDLASHSLYSLLDVALTDWLLYRVVSCL
ncbi:hypothetical protein ACOMHN_016126 [Nucella lapillus]